MKRLVLIKTSLLCLIALNACFIDDSAKPPDDSTRPPATDAPIQTNKQIYTPQISGSYGNFSVIATYINRQDNPVYIPVCGDAWPLYEWEKYEDGRWQADSTVVPAACASELITNAIAPGGRLTKEFPASFTLARTDNLPRFYRIRWYVIDVPSHPDVEPVSNAFEVIWP